jgi:hypothetical protein
MSAWLTPRVRLGATASLIVLIASALLVTPHLFHDDAADAPGSLTSVESSIDLHTVPPPPSRTSPIVLPHVVHDEPDVTPRPPSLGQLSPRGGASPSTQADSAELESGSGSDLNSPTDQDSAADSAGASYSLAADGSAGADQFAANGLLVPPSGGSDGPRGGNPKQQQPVPLGYGNGGGSAPGPVVSPSIALPVIQSIAPPLNGSGSGDDTGPPPEGPPGPPPIEPPIKPPDPPVVQVPEPASLMMAGMGALGFMIRARLARKRRG